MAGVERLGILQLVLRQLWLVRLSRDPALAEALLGNVVFRRTPVVASASYLGLFNGTAFDHVHVLRLIMVNETHACVVPSAISDAATWAGTNRRSHCPPV